MEQRLDRRLARTGRETRGRRASKDTREASGSVNTVNFVTIPASIVPDQEIVVFGEQRLTYAQLNDLSRGCRRSSNRRDSSRAT